MGRTKKNRDRTVDIVRGFGIIIMVYGHVGLGLNELWELRFSIWYHAFHMPLFYIVSGYFFSRKEKNLQPFISIKARQLLLPYCFWGLFHAIFNLIESGNFEDFRNTLINHLIIHTTSTGFIGGTSIWFLLTLFWINTIYFVMDYIFDNKRILLWGISLFIGICGMYLPSKGIFLPIGLDTAIVGLIFFAFGDVLKTYSNIDFFEVMRKMKWYVFLLVFILINTLIFNNDEVNFRAGLYQNFFSL